MFLSTFKCQIMCESSILYVFEPKLSSTQSHPSSNSNRTTNQKKKIDHPSKKLPPLLNLMLLSASSAVVFLWPTEKLEESQLPCLQSCLNMSKEKPSWSGSNEDGEQIRNWKAERLEEEATVLCRVRKLMHGEEE